MFQSHGVNTDQFAFYDQPAFLERGKLQPEYLAEYARWVTLRPADDSYRAHVRSIVPRLAQLISRSLIEDQWEGSCVAATALISRMLAIFIDSANLYSAARAIGFDIDFRKLLELFSAQGRLVRAFYYTALVEDQEYSPLRPVVDWLDYNGYTLVTKPTKEFTAAMGPTPWGGGRSRAIWTPRSPSM